MSGFIKLKVFPLLLVALMSTGCSDDVEKLVDGAEELIDDLFDDKNYAGEINFPAQVSSQCPSWSRRETVVIDASMKLPENCVFEQVTVRLSGSDIDFDCNNAVFNGMTKVGRNEYRDEYRVEEAPHGIAFFIGDNENTAVRSGNINIKNCQIINYIHAVDVQLSLTAATRAALRKGEADEDVLRAKAPANIRVINSKIINTHGSGIYINRYVTGFQLLNSSLKGAGGPGLYLDAGSRSATVDGSVLEGNGYFSYDDKARVREARRSDKSRREAIAIDASTRHVITNNTFRDNADGGVYLYKNCWEHADNPNQLPRPEGADFNRIEGNKFIKETTGVWMAERADRDLSGFECGDALIYENTNDDKKYYRDFARENSVINNTFDNNGFAIRVMDDANVIRGNTFAGSENFDIDVGSAIRQTVGDPVSGTLMSGNTLSKTDGIRFRNGAD